MELERNKYKYKMAENSSELKIKLSKFKKQNTMLLKARKICI